MTKPDSECHFHDKLRMILEIGQAYNKPGGADPDYPIGGTNS